MAMKERLTVVTRKGQVTIPAEIRRALSLKEGDIVAWVMDEGHVRLHRSGSVVARTAGILKSEVPALSVEERAAAEQAMAEEAARRSNG
jgi:AbrB family looped-hinge helix DNA binding protein